MRMIDLCEMTWPEVREALAAGFDRVIIPVASIEQHGYHLPENTDEVLGKAVAMLTAQKLGRTLVAPSIRPGISPHHMAMAGTLTLRPETLRMIMEDYADCYVRHGFRAVVFLASHGGNVGPCREAVKRLSAEYPQTKILFAADVPTPEELRALEIERGLPAGTNGGHADERETSEMLSLRPELVRMELAKEGYCGPLDGAVLDKFFTEGVTSLTEVGCVGDPRLADADAGRWYRERAAERICAQLQAAL